MKANKIVLALILCVCALATLVLKPERANANPEFEPAATLVVELLPLTPDGRILVLSEEIQERTAEVIRRRLNPQGNKKIRIKSENLNRLIISLSERSDLAKAEAMVVKTGRLEFRAAVTKSEKTELEWVTRLDGSSVEHAVASFGNNMGSWSINVNMTTQGSRDFAELTKELLGKPLGIFFDGEEISAPVIQTVITEGQAVITGNFTKEEATEMASYLNAGDLPVRVKLVSSTPLHSE